MDLCEARQCGFTPAARHPWELTRLAIVQRLIARHLTLDPGAVVLDVGCGDTFVVEQLALANPLASCYALDTAFTDELLAHYRAQLQAPNVFVSSSLDAITPPHAVSLVLLMDVLEHIADDEEFLTTLLAHPAILPETRIFVTVPSYQSLFGSHDIALGHHRRYSNRRLRRLLEAAGLTMLRHRIPLLVSSPVAGFSGNEGTSIPPASRSADIRFVVVGKAAPD